MANTDPDFVGSYSGRVPGEFPATILPKPRNLGESIVAKWRDEASAAHHWRPIETAPKDGTHVLLYRKCADGGASISEAWWRRDIMGKNFEWGGLGWNYPNHDQPTHWMPLPPPPIGRELTS